MYTCAWLLSSNFSNIHKRIQFSAAFSKIINSRIIKSATDFINKFNFTDLPLANLADLFHTNNKALELCEALIVGEYVTIDDNLPVAEAVGADWEDTRLFRFKEGQSDATESSGDSEADEEQVKQPGLINSEKYGLM